MKVKFHNPEYPDGLEFDIGGLLLLNGKTKDFTKEELEQYKSMNGIDLKDRLSVNPYATVDGKQGKVKYLTPEKEDDTAESAEKEGEK